MEEYNFKYRNKSFAAYMAKEDLKKK